MNVRSPLLMFLGGLLCGLPVMASERPFPPFLYAAEGAGKVLQYGSDGKVVWEYPAEMSRDAWVLPNGNVLFCFNKDYDPAKHDNPSGVMEVTRDKKLVFEFSTTGQVWSCQRLADGNTLVGAASQGKLLIVNPKGNVVKAIRVVNAPGHSCMRTARGLSNGHFLVAEESSHAAREYDADGKLVWEVKLTFAPFSAVRLDNGNTIVCGEQTMVEVNSTGTTTWTIQGKDLPGMGIRWFAGIQALPDGNIFVCNAGGKVPLVELSHDKKVVWQSPGGVDFPLGHGVQRLDCAGLLRR